jgi:hypothetical protein
MRGRRDLPTALLAIALGCGGRSDLDVVGDARNASDATAGGDPAEVPSDGGGPDDEGSSDSGTAAEAGMDSGTASEGPDSDEAADGPVEESPAAAADGGCASGQVTFQLIGPSQDWYVADWLGADPGCFWLTLSSLDGGVLDLAYPYPILVDCRGCTNVGQPIGCGYGPVGASMTWNGEYFAVSTCGGRATACAAPTCAPPGQYVATMCAFSEANGAKDCIEVPFTYPSAATVTGALPGGDF